MKRFGSAYGTTNLHGHTTVCQGSLYFTCKAISEQYLGGSFADGKKFLANGNKAAATAAGELSYTNAAEFLAGTNPRDKASLLRVEVVHVARVPAVGPDFVLQFAGVAGRAYVVEARPSLLGGEWKPVIEIGATAASQTYVQSGTDPMKGKGCSGSGSVQRSGFLRLLDLVFQGEVGAVFALDASRLARNNRDWHHLVDLCAMAQTLVIDHDGVYEPHLLNDQLLLGLKGTMIQPRSPISTKTARAARPFHPP